MTTRPAPSRAFVKSGGIEVFKLKHDNEILVRDARVVYALDPRADIVDVGKTMRRFCTMINAVPHRAELTFLANDPSVSVVLTRHNADLHVWDVVEKFVLVPREKRKKFCPQCGACME